MKRGTPRHFKVFDLMRLARVRRSTAVGWLELLWHATAEFAPQGDIGRCSDEWIEAQLDWCGAPGKLISFLIEARWIDRHSKWRLLVHDWHEHADESTRKRLQRSGLWFHDVSAKVTGQYPVSDGKVSASSAESVRLPEPKPEPKPEPVSPLPPKVGTDAAKPRRKVTYSDDFLEWYGWYPRNEDKFTAAKNWGKLNDTDKVNALEGIKRQAPAMITKAKADGIQFLPLPATWISKRRWEDGAVSAQIALRPEAIKTADSVVNDTDWMDDNDRRELDALMANERRAS